MVNKIILFINNNKVNVSYQNDAFGLNQKGVGKYIYNINVTYKLQNETTISIFETVEQETMYKYQNKAHKNLFCNKISCTFALPNKKHNYSAFLSTLIQDNTPPRLAAMQHTWEVFSFYAFPKPIF